jgi:hypothetical protein
MIQTSSSLAYESNLIHGESERILKAFVRNASFTIDLQTSLLSATGR